MSLIMRLADFNHPNIPDHDKLKLFMSHIRSKAIEKYSVNFILSAEDSFEKQSIKQKFRFNTNQSDDSDEDLEDQSVISPKKIESVE